MLALKNRKTFCLSLTSICLLASTDYVQAEDWHYSAQAGVANAPRYSGSDERVTAPLLGGQIVSPYGLFLDTERGLGWQNEWGDLAFSTYIGLSETRKDRKSRFEGSNRLDGMGSIKSRPQLGASIHYTLGEVVVGATLEHALKKSDDDRDTGSAYNRLELSISTNLYEGEYGSLDGSLNSVFGDADYVRTWYGVSTAQASRSQFRAYATHGGMVSRGAALTWAVPINDQTEFSTVLAMQYLNGDAADSPIVERRTQTSLAGQVKYSF
ncbi:MipA/OmpV family protein [Pseudomonas helvetica]|uniref:MipA/OmpV family protein n=1 Tax=Pseudomonas helvetica TaxID=3136738 RepID=UPI00326446D0